MINIRNTILYSCLALVIAGCTTADTVKEAKGQGTVRVYGYSYEVLFQATLDAAVKQELEVVEKDRSKKLIMLSHGTTWMSWGENIAVFFKIRSEKSTEVEIIMKPVMQPLNFPKDWETILHDQIATDLKKRN
jgi:hypothetical protein